MRPPSPPRRTSRACIRATTPSVPGGSTYGVRLGGGSGRLFVRFDTIEAGKGADGGNGADGLAPESARAPKGKGQARGTCRANVGGEGGAASTCTESGGAGGPGSYVAESVIN